MLLNIEYYNTMSADLDIVGSEMCAGGTSTIHDGMGHGYVNTSKQLKSEHPRE